MAGRPRGFDRDAALAVAVELFWRDGYDGTSVASLTRAMGVAPPSLYAAFGDKDHLFQEASALYFTRTTEGVDAALARPTVREAVTKMLDDTARAHTDRGTPAGCLMLTEPRLVAQRQDVHDRLVARIARGARDGDVPSSVEPGQLASFLVAVMRGMSACARDGGSLEELRAIASQALAALPGPPPPQDRRSADDQG